MQMLKVNIKPAGKNFMASSSTLKCIKIAPIIKPDIRSAEGIVILSLKKPINSPKAAKIFNPPIRYTIVSFNP